MPNPIKRLYSRLGQVGLTRAFVVRTAFPHWWDDEIANNPAGYAQGLMLLSRHLGLDLASLQGENTPLKMREFGVCKFKKRAVVSEDQLALARVMATRTAQLAAAAMPDAPLPWRRTFVMALPHTPSTCGGNAVNCLLRSKALGLPRTARRSREIRAQLSPMPSAMVLRDELNLLRNLDLIEGSRHGAGAKWWLKQQAGVEKNGE